MAGGRVIDVHGANVRETNQPARTVVVEKPDGSWIAFEIPIGNEPAIGTAIEWGPHYAWWDDQRVHKLTWERDPDAPLSAA